MIKPLDNTGIDTISQSINKEHINKVLEVRKSMTVKEQVIKSLQVLHNSKEFLLKTQAGRIALYY